MLKRPPAEHWASLDICNYTDSVARRVRGLHLWPFEHYFKYLFSHIGSCPPSSEDLSPVSGGCMLLREELYEAQYEDQV